MVARRKSLKWAITLAKPFAVIYVVILALAYLSPGLRLDRAIEDVLHDVFVIRAITWVWGVPVAFVFLNAAWLAVAFLRQAWVNYRIDARGAVRIVLPRVDAQTGAGDAVQFWNQVSDLIPKHQHITFELAGSSLGVNFAITADAGANRALITQMMADWPGTQSRPVETPEEDPLHIEKGKSTYCLTLRPKQADRPIQTAVKDVLAAPLVEIARLPEGVKGGVLLLIRGDSITKQRLGETAAKETAAETTGKSLEQKREIKAADTRAQHVFLEVRLLIWAAAGTSKMAQSVARSLTRSVIAQYEATNPLEQVSETEKPPRRVFPLFSGRPWTDEELATLAHLEGKTGAAIAPQLETAPARPLPPSPDCRIPPQARTVTHLATVGGEA